MTEMTPEPARQASARAAIPGVRWWCTPAVDLGPRICADCYNASAPGCVRCLSCIDRKAQHERNLAVHSADLYAKRELAVDSGDLAMALRIDATLECHYNLPCDDRATCYQCQSWGDHAHHPRTNALMTLVEWDTYTAARPDLYGTR